jgi:hypothetical protein
VLSILGVLPAQAQYLQLLHKAAAHAEVPNSLLLAIAWVESRGVLTALNVAGDAYYPTTFVEGHALLARHAAQNVDVGVMQVHVPTWSPRLNLSAQTLYRPEVNLPVGAAILRHCLDHHRGDLWKGVGCYHSQKLTRQRRYVHKVWNAYNLLKRRGIFGPQFACADGEDLGRGGDACRVIQRRVTARPVRQVGHDTVPIQPPESWHPPQAVLPTCPDTQPRVRTVRGTARISFVFFAPGQAWPDVGAGDGQLTLGMCVGCQPSDLTALSHHLSIPVHSASPELLAELNVSCVPTVVTTIR